tara:strand:+ start:242 stop:628 length:387 start_codon:yes stop_codon:yes gene_type:complete
MKYTLQMSEDEYTTDKVESIIGMLKSLTPNGDSVDGETLQYILEKVGMDDQMLKQLQGTSELKHRLSMVEDDLRVIKEFIYTNGLRDWFNESSRTSDAVWNNLNNIEIACDLSSDESLQWKLYENINQ